MEKNKYRIYPCIFVQLGLSAGTIFMKKLTKDIQKKAGKMKKNFVLWQICHCTSHTDRSYFYNCPWRKKKACTIIIHSCIYKTHNNMLTGVRYYSHKILYHTCIFHISTDKHVQYYFVLSV